MLNIYIYIYIFFFYVNGIYYYCGKIQKPDIYRDEYSFNNVNGHGIRCASVAARTKSETILFNTFLETIVGLAPSARIYPYKSYRGERNHDTFKGFIAAIEQKVDVNSILVAINFTKSYNNFNDIVVGSFLAMKSNILTIATAENFGPSKALLKTQVIVTFLKHGFCS